MSSSHTTRTGGGGTAPDGTPVGSRPDSFGLGMPRPSTFRDALRVNINQLNMRGALRGAFEALSSTTHLQNRHDVSFNNREPDREPTSANSEHSSSNSPLAFPSPASVEGVVRNNSFSFSHRPRWSRYERQAYEEDEFERQRLSTINFARGALDHYGNLDPMELAMLQAEQQMGYAEDDQEQLTAAEVLANIELLNEKEFAVLTEATHKQQMEAEESTLMYHGAAWYLPQITQCDDCEKQNSFDFSMEDGEMGLVIAVWGSRITIPLLSLFLRAIIAVMCWIVLWLAFGAKLLEPGGYIFDPVACFLVCSIVGGILGRVFGVPPLLFVLGMSVMWSNVPTPGALVGGIAKEVRNVIGSVALAVILTRSGLGMSWAPIKPAAGTILSMSLFPMLTEIVVHGFLASHLIDYGDSSLWPFLQAMTCAPAAAAIVSATTLLVRSWGYGTTRGPGVLLVPAASLESSLGILGIPFMVSLVFRDPNSSLAWAIGLGPLSIVVGILSGIVLGLLWYGCLLLLFKEARVLPHGRYARAFLRRVARTAAFAMALLGIMAVFVGKELGALGGAALTCVIIGATGNYMMTGDDAPEHMHIVRGKMYAMMGSVWDLLLMPALFSITISSIRVTTLFDPAFIGQAVACLFTGVAARLVVTTLCTWSYEMTMSERVISILATTGRATAQVALGPLALSFAEALPDSDIGKADALRYAAHVYDASILGVLIFTPISVILLTRVAPNYWLTDAEHAKLDKEAARKLKKERGEETTSDADGDGGDDSAAEGSEAPDFSPGPRAAAAASGRSSGGDDDGALEMQARRYGPSRSPVAGGGGRSPRPAGAGPSPSGPGGWSPRPGGRSPLAGLRSPRPGVGTSPSAPGGRSPRPGGVGPSPLALAGRSPRPGGAGPSPSSAGARSPRPGGALPSPSAEVAALVSSSRRSPLLLDRQGKPRSPLPLDRYGNPRAASRPLSASRPERPTMEGVSTPPARPLRASSRGRSDNSARPSSRGSFRETTGAAAGFAGGELRRTSSSSRLVRSASVVLRPSSLSRRQMTEAFKDWDMPMTESPPSGAREQEDDAFYIAAAAAAAVADADAHHPERRQQQQQEGTDDDDSAASAGAGASISERFHQEQPQHQHQEPEKGILPSRDSKMEASLESFAKVANES